METFLIRALQLMMSLSLLVIIHEGGHYLFARLFKIRVEKFYLFFDPWFALFRYKPKGSHTEYGVGWLPLGGYVKIAGMIDESMDKEQMAQPPKPWEFRSKPAWQRLLVMVGGVLFNFLLALFIYSMILFAWGDSYYALPEMDRGMKFNERAQAIGFRDGDVLLRADDKPFERYGMDMLRDIVDARTVTVRRDGAEHTVYIPEDLSLLTVGKEQPIFVDVLVPARVDSVLPETPAMRAGMMPGDSLVTFNGKPLNSWNAFTENLLALRNKAAMNPAGRDEYATVALGVVRATGVADTLTLRLDSTFVAGVAACPLTDYYRPHVEEYTFFSSFPAGVRHGVQVLSGYVDDRKYVFTKEGAQSLGGFGTIGSIFPTEWNWPRFWEMTAFLSIILAFMNILPIPALDGGHVFFLIYEIVARRKPSDKFMERAQIVGMSILFLLLIWANFNDILRFLF